jgi:SAM-dependent methyltransferase
MEQKATPSTKAEPTAGDQDFVGPKDRFLALVQESLKEGSFVRLTLGGHIGVDRSLRRVLVRLVLLRQGPRLSFVFRHATRDITKNFTEPEGIFQLDALIGSEFRTAHLGTTKQTVELEYRRGQEPRLTTGQPGRTAGLSLTHDRVRPRTLPLEQAPWLQDLGVTTADGSVAKGMEAKLRQIQKFVELLQHLTAEAKLFAIPSSSEAGGEESVEAPCLSLVDMGCGKGYLTFAAHTFLQNSALGAVRTLGVDTRAELVELCRQTAQKHRLEALQFQVGDIAATPVDGVDVLVALHACDTATDDALAKGIQAGASLILASPCCHKEIRPQIRPPSVLQGALKHGILLGREAEFVTDALRAALLEWAGYDARVFEFIATEHTSKNLMIAACKRRIAGPRAEREKQIRELAAFYGIRSHRLAERLGVSLLPMFPPVHG